MSLGFARDSVHDLASLASSGKLLTKKNEMSIEGESSEVTLSDSQLETTGARFDLDPKKTQEEFGQAITNVDVTSPDSASTTTSSYGHYTGFTSDYSDYEQYGVMFDQYSQSSLVLGQAKPSKGGFWCCVFPWAVNKNTSETTEEDDEDDTGASNEGESTRSEDDASTASATYYGEKLTENERAAILGRLRLAGPESTTPGNPSGAHPPSTEPTLAPSKKGLLPNGLPKKDEEAGDETPVKKLKPILKKGSFAVTPNAGNLTNSTKAIQSENGRRRSLFPQQYEQTPKSDKTIRFSPMARVVAIKSKNEMSDMERALIWWQKQDYEDFKKTGRMIAKAMCEGGSEIWLASNNAWQNKAGRIGAASPRAHHLSERSTISKSENGKTTNGDKWWHHFGHSRRGLEHIASVEEGRQRQANVRIAINVVIDEQRRQKTYRKEDPEKLRMLSLQYTTWARELALAAAASDAEAVKVDFNENRKSREFYILKQARSQGGLPKALPSFMMPVAVSPQILDHHTSTQIRYRRKQARVSPSPLQKSDGTGPNPVATSEPIHDGSTSNTTTKLAKQAAGFGTTDTDVSAILSGLGTVDENSMPPMKPHMTSVGAH